MSNASKGTVDPSYAIERLNEEHEIGAFDCGDTTMNTFLVDHALNNAALDFGVTHVLIGMNSSRVLGYYTLSSASMVPKDVFPSKKRWGLPPYQIPVVRLGRLAVDNSESGKGLGKYLLMDAMRRLLRWSEEIGVHGMDAHAINDTALPFYTRFGFVQLRDSNLHVFLPMATIRELFEG